MVLVSTVTICYDKSLNALHSESASRNLPGHWYRQHNSTLLQQWENVIYLTRNKQSQIKNEQSAMVNCRSILCCECLPVVSRPSAHSWRHCCLYDTLYRDSNIFSLQDSTFAAFVRGSFALQIALLLIIIIIRLCCKKCIFGKCCLWPWPLKPKSILTKEYR